MDMFFPKFRAATPLQALDPASVVLTHPDSGDYSVFSTREARADTINDFLLLFYYVHPALIWISVAFPFSNIGKMGLVT